ncbi:uncharacterized protein BO97DRAFT_79708 [Aspergillus homomorphus CBS 101889]|uniref:Uncharacterized protein n=1 Tax=Aspergillus homomorphus (strain CBS 101889) TaxID=1450537 RepID=A0A395IFI6_ASPHC|nr:hypothetical protein BO97DRAFT_79708 [Aspergillus homomorphus CBS 101889]RAL16944.1 hypothetical protein BO97DRAFT_79708 [Aspergillus homomorphus CBS 101889]
MCHMEVHCYSCNHFYAYKACCVRYQEPDHQEPPARTYLVPGLCLICRQPPTKVNLKKRSLLLTVQQMEIIMDIPHTAEGFLDSVARFYLRGDHDRWSQPGYVRPRDPRQVMAEEEYLKSLEVSHGVDTDNDNTAAAAAVGSGPGAECDRGFANMHASSSFGHSILSSEPGRVYPLYEPDTDIQPWLPVEVRSTATGQARLVTGDNNDHTQRVGSMVAGSLLEDWGMTAEVVHPSARREDAGEANGNQVRTVVSQKMNREQDTLTKTVERTHSPDCFHHMGRDTTPPPLRLHRKQQPRPMADHVLIIGPRHSMSKPQLLARPPRTSHPASLRTSTPPSS